ncbi:TetR family transcriptional regulator [Sphingomonas bacterium]|uniref:TetR family transcriptional regulator n=1 Tax=Sphingomonas bacterium TaxID=1895847 RepID=UPI0015761B83|nr:TetR family transcriptional regulator [Sphingomonas bacterium]
MNTRSLASVSHRRVAGRPRRLTLQAIVDAACAIGIERVEMAALAERLGVGVATLYGYVRGREHLLELVADQRGRRELLVDRGQPWDELLREHAAGSFVIYTVWPQLVALMMHGGLGREAEAPYLDHLLALLLDRGIASSDALLLYYRVNQIVIGAAVGAAYARAVAAGSQATDPVARHLLDADDLPALRRCVADGADSAAAACGDYRAPLELLIADHHHRIASEGAAKERNDQ